MSQQDNCISRLLYQRDQDQLEPILGTPEVSITTWRASLLSTWAFVCIKMML
ncbi:hypothetical protein COLO4_21411 [Corchorus olitorius]|uniref:Uncharacterized protein n=1 Tax=Corchorus olitorius TaxID=93759 RepID=A0A1R3ITE8_9ROSI|nr:hypothetical protein COLO4_21411 [Corchorus olitorius]